MTTDEIIMSFRQGGSGNCVSIAIIKAGIEILGINKIFHSEMKGEKCVFTMRDGFSSELSMEELKAGSFGSKFILKNNVEVYNYANLCFSAMAKRAQIEENDDFSDMTFEKAIDTLNDGEYYTYGPYWLGLKHHIKPSGRKYIYHYPGVVGASKKHCFFASFGIEDNYGSPDPIDGLDRRFCSWFRLTTDPSY